MLEKESSNPEYNRKPTENLNIDIIPSSEDILITDQGLEDLRVELSRLGKSLVEIIASDHKSQKLEIQKNLLAETIEELSLSFKNQKQISDELKLEINHLNNKNTALKQRLDDLKHLLFYTNKNIPLNNPAALLSRSILEVMACEDTSFNPSSMYFIRLI